MRRAVFVDRDGVLNQVLVRDGTTVPPRGLEEVRLLAGVGDALTLLGEMGLLRIVVTNQPDVPRGRQTRAAVERIHEHLMGQLPLDAVFTCYHDHRDGCSCRKPLPGLLLEAAAAHGIDLEASFMVGDRLTDVAAGRAAGCTTFLVTGAADGSAPALAAASVREQASVPDFEVRDLLEAARKIESIVAGRQ